MPSPNYRKSSAQPKPIQHTPDLPSIDWASLGASAPTTVTTKPNHLEEADAVIITYAESEWAALQQVFVNSASPMPYSDRTTSYWDGWHEFKEYLPTFKDWNYWFYYRLVEVNGKKVYIIKSNTHLDFPGIAELEKMMELILDFVKPKLVLSIGTAGGAKVDDHIGSVNITNAGILYSKGDPTDRKENPLYANDWQASMDTINSDAFQKQLFPIPTVESDLNILVDDLNASSGKHYTLHQLNPGGVDYGSSTPIITSMCKTQTPLVTTESFVIATSDGNFGSYACMEMDDAIIGKVCNAYNTSFGFVRNISDPVEAAGLPSTIQNNWGGALYSTYGFYTSFNGALAAWAQVNAM